MSSTTIQVSALVVVTFVMIVSLCTIGTTHSTANTDVAAVASTQLNG